MYEFGSRINERNFFVRQILKNLYLMDRQLMKEYNGFQDQTMEKTMEH